MNFCEAMDLLKSGVPVTRDSWKGSLYFFYQDGNVTSFQPRLREYTYDEGIMVSNGWIIEGDNTTEYNFCEIIPFLQKDKKAAMKDWDRSFIFLDKNTGRLVIHMMEAFPFIPSFEAFSATDWIIDDLI